MTKTKTDPYINDDAIDWLLKNLEVNEASISSLWRDQVAHLKYDDGELQGLTGFGNYEAPLHGLKRFFHWFLMTPFRRMGSKFKHFSKIDRIAREIAARQNRNYNLDILRQAITVSFLLDHVPNDLESEDGLILAIGDGFGTFSALILEVFPKARVVFINLTKVLLVDIIYLRKGVPGVNVALVNDTQSLATALADKSIRAISIQSDDAYLLKHLPISLATNIVAMQEMNPPVIAEYFDAMRHSTGNAPMFYCCSREVKTLPDGVVVRFDDYPWEGTDQVIVDELCPWNKYRYATRPPFYPPYDGTIRHRLARLSKV